MPQDVTCPACQATFPVTESRTAFTVACPHCDAEMTVEFRKPAAPPEPGQPRHALHVTPGALPAPELPRPRTKRDIDGEDAEPQRASGSVAIVLLSGGCGMLMVLGGLGLTAWVLFGLIDTTPPVAYNRSGTNPPPINRVTPPSNTFNPPNNAFTPPRNTFVPPNNSFIPPQPKDTFDLRPVTAALPSITPAPLDADPATVKLERVGMVAVGGGGRYLVMHLPDKGQLTVFDTSAGQFTATVPADTGDAHLTAGVSKVVLAAPNARIFRVYSLPGLTKEYDSTGPAGIRGMAMGSRTNGPMATVEVFGEVKLWDIGASGITEVEGASGKPGVHWHDRCLRAAPDGTAFSTYDGFHSSQNAILLTTQNRKWQVSADIYPVPYPGVDGNFYGNGIVVSKAYQDQRVGGIGASSGVWFVPSVSSKDYFLKVAPLTIGFAPTQQKTLAVSVHKGRNSEATAPGTTVLSDLPEFEGMVDPFRGNVNVACDQHFFLIPQAKLFITITAKRDRLVVRRINPR
ncbi:hypothetical protein R5W24_002665 [Gemmata sp. JC717]|uniref:hypothetical protein n=1 Tax=Gemmata algarum TaxID=2975278 RepID=UPI0021BA88DC|nr:hypothetical protein [Gemmata algarum]MDY3553562.1 hypothetical protein [Gemmata algarum]